MADSGSTYKPIYVLIGTKAQYIKTAPLLRLMQERSIDYTLIDSGQHAAFSKGLRRELGVKDPDVVLADSGNVKSIGAAAIWFARFLFMSLFQRRYLESTVFSRGRGFCILHGDTPSTLVGLMLAKRTGQKVVHIEAGLRSHNVFKPFPEELIRIICMRFSDLLFAPADWAYENIRKMKVRGDVINVHQNSSVEAMYHSLSNAPAPGRSDPYVLMTIHRVETLFSKSRVNRVVELAEQIAASCQLVFVLHDPTEVRLRSYGLLHRLEDNPSIEITGLQDHAKFLRLVEGAEFVVTDGGSIQEETYYLDVPCLVMRSETERQEGIGTNVVIGGFDEAKISDFLKNHERLRRGGRIENTHPSKAVLDEICTRGANCSPPRELANSDCID